MQTAPEGTNHVLGPDEAPINTLFYLDLKSERCAALYHVLRALQREHGLRMLLQVRHFPPGDVRLAWLAAEALECASAQRQFWPMLDCLMRNQSWLSQADLVECAVMLALNARRFLRELTQHRYAENVQRDVNLGLRAGVVAAPALFINSKPLVLPQETGIAAVTMLRTTLGQLLKDQHP